MTTRNQELEKMAKDLSRVDQFSSTTHTGLIDLKWMFLEMQKQWEDNFERLASQQSNPSNGGNNNGGGNNGQVGRICNNRLTKMDFPKFEGEDVEGWIYKAEHFFSLDETPDNYKIRYAALHLDGRALAWHLTYVKSSGKDMRDIGWHEYMRAISARFAQTLIEDAMGALKALTQTGDLDNYCDDFDILLNKVNIVEEYAVSLFIEGLKPEIKCPLRMFKPRDLRETYFLARLQDKAKILVHWEGLPISEASWEFLEDMQSRFPHFSF